jgi:hypothetical protein
MSNANEAYGSERWETPRPPTLALRLHRRKSIMAFDFGNILQQYLGGGASANPHQASDDFDRVAQSAPRTDVAQGVTQALRSDQTPPFSQMVSQLFSNGNPDQRAGVLQSLAGGVLGNLRGADQGQVSPDQASQVSPDTVRQLAEHAEQTNPGVVERMGDFYADHPTLVKALGGAALAVALGHMAQGIQRQ